MAAARAAAADTGEPRTRSELATLQRELFAVREFTEFTQTDYLRVEPAPSDYLTTAVAPVPWPTRTGPNVSVGGLLLGKERTGTGPPIRR